MPNLTFLEFQTFPDSSCTSPSPSIAVAFNNCCLHTHTRGTSETSCRFLAHYSLLGSTQPTQGVFQFLSVPGCCLPRAGRRAWSRWPCGRSAVRSDEYQVPPSFSELASSDVFQPQALQVSHLPLPRVQTHRAQQSMPPGVPLHGSFQLEVQLLSHTPCTVHAGFTPYSELKLRI